MLLINNELTYLLKIKSILLFLQYLKFQQLSKYCESKNIPINKCGKLVVAKNESELLLLDELMSRAKTNEVPLNSISEKEAKTIEPRVKTFERALFSPTTSSVNPQKVVQAMCADAIKEGLILRKQVRYLKKIDKMDCEFVKVCGHQLSIQKNEVDF